MPAIRPASYQIQVKVFESAGCEYVRTQRDHLVFSLTISGTSIVVNCVSCSKGTLASSVYSASIASDLSQVGWVDVRNQHTDVKEMLRRYHF